MFWAWVRAHCLRNAHSQPDSTFLHPRCPSAYSAGPTARAEFGTQQTELQILALQPCS